MSCTSWNDQQQRNSALLAESPYMAAEVRSDVLPFRLAPEQDAELTNDQAVILEALEIEAAQTAIRSLASLATINELDHLGGGLDLIPALTMTLAVTDFEAVEYTIEHAHTSIGYYGALAAYGFLDPTVVIDTFRRGLDIAGHVSWVPGGTQLNGGRLGVMIPAAVGQALGKRSVYGDAAWVLAHCGDAGWISGQALNGFNAADLHDAPITFVMHRNGIQLSGTNRQIMDKDPRPIIEALGIDIIETPSLHDAKGLFTAYREARMLAKEGHPNLIYPTGTGRDDDKDVDLYEFGREHGISDDVEAFAQANGVAMDTRIWSPGCLMSYRDVESMLECLFKVNDLPGGKHHHDGHMKGRDVDTVLANPMLQLSAQHRAALDGLRSQPARTVVTEARPTPGTPNLIVDDAVASAVCLPDVGQADSPRAGVEAGYAMIAKAFPEQVFIVSCDLDASTKLGKARTFIPEHNQFELSIEEQIAAIMTNGLAVTSRQPQLNVFSTFAAFFEGIAREGMEMWRYQRNLNGSNEGLNATFHMSHVGACTGRDHFTGWSLDWITLSMGYLPYLHRFYAPADARAAFVAIRDLAAHYGAHIIGIPRDKLPILDKQDGSGPLWETDSAWEPITEYRVYDGAERAILAMGAPAYLGAEAADVLQADGVPTDVHIVNGLPLPDGELAALISRYPNGVVTIEDGIIATRELGIRGFASLVAGAAGGTPVEHVGIVDPRIAPSEGHHEVWAHFGLTTDALVAAVRRLGA